MTEQVQKGAPHEEVSPADLAKPEAGSWLDQHWTSWVSGEVRKLLGEFTPRQVGMDTYFLMQLHPTVAFGTAILRAPIINMSYKVTGKDPKICAFIEQSLRPKWGQMATTLTNAMKWGWQVAEEVLAPRPFTISTQEKAGAPVQETKLPMAWLFDEFKSIDPRTLQLAVNPATDKFWGVWQNNFGTVHQDTPPPVPASRVALWSFRKDDVFGKLQGFPIYDQVYGPWYASVAMELYANRYFERRADPTIVAYGDNGMMVDENGKPIDVVAFLLKLMAAIKQGTNVVLPAGFDDKGNRRFELKYLMDDKRGDMFQQRIAALDTSILRAHFITDRAGTTHGSAGGGLGTGGEAQVHQETLEQTMESNQREFIDQVVNPQVVDRQVLYNFGEQALAESHTKVVPSGLTATQRDALKEILFKLMDQQASVGAGSALPIYQMFDVPGLAQAMGAPLLDPDDLQAVIEAHQKEYEQQQKAAADMAAAGAAAGGGPGGDGTPKGAPKPKPAAAAAGKKAALDFLQKSGVTK